MSDFFSQHKLKFLSGLGIIGVGSTAASCVALNGSKEVEQVLEPEVQPELVVETEVKEQIIEVEEERPVEPQAPEVEKHNAPAEVHTVPEEPPEQLDVADEPVEAETTTAETPEIPPVRNPIPEPESVRATESAVEVKAAKPAEKVEEKVEPKAPVLQSDPSEQKMPPPPQITPVTRVFDPRIVAEIDRLSKVPPRGAVAAASANVSYGPIATDSVDWNSVDLGWGDVDLATYPVNSIAGKLKNNNYLLGKNASLDLWKSRAIAAWNRLYHLTDEELSVYDSGFSSFVSSMRRNWQDHKKQAGSWGDRLKGACTASYYRVNAEKSTWYGVYDFCRTPDAPNVLYTE